MKKRPKDPLAHFDRFFHREDLPLRRTRRRRAPGLPTVAGSTAQRRYP
jgi:hypothetical protein